MPQPQKMTPMLRQYFELKRSCPDAILLYRMGDFYEMFFEDAERAAPVLDIALTSRNRASENEAPMCGVPHHSVDSYIGKLLEAGFKVAVCDQVEDARAAKGLVRREIVRTITPGTVTSAALLEEKRPRYLCSAVLAGGTGGGAIAAVDITTGEFFTVPLGGGVGAEGHDRMALELESLSARELVIAAADEAAVRANPRLAGLLGAGLTLSRLEEEDDIGLRQAREILLAHLHAQSLAGFGLEGEEAATLAAARVLRYAQRTQRAALANVTELAVRRDGAVVYLDATTQRNLELFASARDGSRDAGLFAAIDETLTSPGARLLGAWLARPLADIAAIERRQDVVAALAGDTAARAAWRAPLGGGGDLERLASRVALGAATPRDLAQLGAALARIPPLRDAVAATAGNGVARAAELAAALDPVDELAREILHVLVEAPPLSALEGGLVRPGVSTELDDLRALSRGAKGAILALEEQERLATGIANLRIRYNRVFGYYIEVSKGQLARVPPEYIRKQTLVGAERYVTPEMKELEVRILGAEEKAQMLEATLFARLLELAAAVVDRLVRTARAAAEADVLAALAELAATRRWTRPRLAAEPVLSIRGGRHPVVEARLRAEPFIANDLELSAPEAGTVDQRTADLGPAVPQIVILTGPNMGGKSTFLRQTAIIAILAHMGSFVPAASATVGLCDRIFCRAGASDDLARGESTFMVEMTETANILHHATPRSLVVLDEVGRGTATFDGLSLAWSIVEHLHDDPRRTARTLFATHYHELTELALVLPRLANATMAVKEWNDEIVFLRRVVPGAADKSYGLEVAKLAGMPREVVARAREVLANLEGKELDMRGLPKLAHKAGEAPPAAAQLVLFKTAEEVVLETLREVRADELTPLAALNLVSALQSRLR